MKSKIQILYGDPQNYLRDLVSSEEQPQPKREIDSFCIIPGYIVQNNLRKKLALEIKNSNNKIQLLTFEDLAKKIIKSYTNSNPIILSDNIRKNFLLEIFEDIISKKIECTKTLYDFFNKVNFTNEEIIKVFDQEFSEYLRSCNSGLEHENLKTICENIESPFWQEKSLEILEIFQFFNTLLENKVKEMGVSIYLSRAHFITYASELIIDKTKEDSDNLFSNIKTINIIGITIIDSPILHLITNLATILPKTQVKIFTGKGSKDLITKRFEGLNIDFEYIPLIQKQVQEKNEYLFWNKILNKDDIEPEINFITAPSIKKEIEEISYKIRKLVIFDKVKPNDIIVVARNIQKYKSYIENVFETAGIPYSIETRYPLAYSTAYRFIKATIDLLSKIEKNENLIYSDITDPLRLGFCLPKRKKATSYPINDIVFLRLEEGLDYLEQKYKQEDSKGLPFIKWQEIISELFPWEYEIINEFLEWVSSSSEISSKNSNDYIKVLNSLVYFYIRNIRRIIFHSISGPGIQNTRFEFFQYHPTYLASRVKSRIPYIRNYLNYISEKEELNKLNWSYISRAIGELAGGESYGVQNIDQNTVSFIDAANLYFRDTNYVFILGMRTEEFPRKCPDYIFMPLEIKKEIENKKLIFAKKNSDFAYLYTNSPENDYATELDYFENILFCTKKQLYISHTYLDREGRRLEWSSFLDSISDFVSDKERKIYPTEIFSFLSENSDLKEYLSILSEKEILKLYNWIYNRVNNNIFPIISKNQFLSIFSLINVEIQKIELKNRIDRFLYPPIKIAVKSNENYLPQEILNNIIGSPYRMHELDLIYNCPLSYYFYQFYFNWFNRDEIERSVPNYYTKRIHYRYGYYPKKLSKVFLRESEKQELTNFIQNKFPKRKDLLQNPVINSIEEFFNDFIDFKKIKYSEMFKIETDILKAELNSNVSREWELKEEEIVDLEDDISITFPLHRCDKIEVIKTNDVREVFYLPVFYNNLSNSLVSNFNFKTDNDLLKSDNFDIRISFSYFLYEEKKAIPFFGIEFIEPFTGKRKGIFKQYTYTKYQLYRVQELYPPNSIEKSIYFKFQPKMSQVKEKLRDIVANMKTNLIDIQNGIFQINANKKSNCKECSYRMLCSGFSINGVFKEDDE